jgi:hypothetical protein
MLTKVQILEALWKWINQRPGLEFGNYGEWKSYRAELRSITRDRSDALQLMQAVSWRDSVTAEDLIKSFSAFSGRLTLKEEYDEESSHGPKCAQRTVSAAECTCHKSEPRAQLSYCTGQYWPTEYRKAAAAVLARALWGAAQVNMPAPHPTKKIKRTFGPFTNEYDSIEGLTPGDWMRRHFRREFGRGIQSRWFN